MRAALLVVFALAGCLRDTTFECMTSAECGSGGTCESTGYCSFGDVSCAQGRRYGGYAGSYSNQCVSGAATGDAGFDASTGRCPATYATLPNAGPHVYKLTPGAQRWATQRDHCAMEGGYLAIPDGEPELVAITAAAAAQSTWVGISDTVTEGMFVTVKGAPATHLPWSSDEPRGQDCVAADMTTPTIRTERCAESLPAVCECEP